MSAIKDQFGYFKMLLFNNMAVKTTTEHDDGL